MKIVKLTVLFATLAFYTAFAQTPSIEEFRNNLKQVSNTKSFQKIQKSNKTDTSKPYFVITNSIEDPSPQEHWISIVNSQSRSYQIKNVSFLDTLSLLLNFRALIYSSGITSEELTVQRRQNIITAIRNGVSVYIQSEYQSAYETNMFFKEITDSLGGTFSWGSTIAGKLAPTTILAPFNSPYTISQLDDYWYGVDGTYDNTTVKPFLQYSGNSLGFYFVPPIEGAGVVVTTSDEDWIGAFQSTSHGDNLMKNILDYLVSENSLPVELTSFTSSIQGNSVLLQWETKTETNNSGWEIEVRSQNNTWKAIGFVEGKGTTTEKQSYRFTDQLSENQSSGLQYRLKQIDFDGKISYSNILSVNPEGKSLSLFQNYPNPFNPSTVISFYLNKPSSIELGIYDVLGRQVQLLSSGYYPQGYGQVVFDGKKLTSGLYFYQLKSEGSTITKSMLIKK